MNQEESKQYPKVRIFTFILLIFVMGFVVAMGVEYAARKFQPKPAIAESPPR